jgi:hypothetical protein
LLRLEKAFYTYMREHGNAPTSMALLARLNYCDESDLRTLDGGYFVLKILGPQENLALISAVNRDSSEAEDLSVEITIR